jgi:hypothetical protein
MDDLRAKLLDGENENGSVTDEFIVTGKKKQMKRVNRKWSDRVICPICGKEYVYSQVSMHRGTRFHQRYVDYKKNLVNEILGLPT